MTSWLLVALGGGLGAVARYAAGTVPLLPSHPHLNTLLVNVAGCLLIGVAWAVIDTWQLPRGWYQVAVAGFLGGFTTYSSFSLETVRLLTGGHVVESMLYALVTVVACIGACACGLLLTQKLLS